MTRRLRPADLAEATRVRQDLRSGSAREQRAATGMSAAKIAAVIGVSRQAVSSWETGQASPSVEHALAYGRALAALGRRAALSLGPGPGAGNLWSRSIVGIGR